MKQEVTLKKSVDFKKAFKEGRKLTGPHFAVYIRKNFKDFSRIGVAITKSQYKLATKRNKLRRIAKEFFKEQIRPNIKGRDVVLVSRPGREVANLKSVIKDLKTLLGKVKKC